MKQSIPRIRTVKMKGGPTVTVLRRGKGDTNAAFMDRARSLDRMFPDNSMVGFAIVAWGADRSWECQYSTSDPRNTVPLNLLPEMAAESIRRMTALEDANRVSRGERGYAWRDAPDDPDGAA